MHAASKSDIEEFLNEFKKIANQQEKNFDFHNNIEYKQNLVEMGFTKTQCRQIIMDLTPSDYYRGPIPDRERSGEFWEFGKNVDGIEIFVKLKLVSYVPIGESEPVKKAKCFSFHKAHYPMTFPYK